jgi:hypothetical protein
MKRAILAAALLAVAPAWLVAQQFISVARTNEIASGVVAFELPTEVRLKVSPCSNASALVVFYPPYVKTKIGTITCGSQVLDQYQVEKQ